MNTAMQLSAQLVPLERGLEGLTPVWQSGLSAGSAPEHLQLRTSSRDKDGILGIGYVKPEERGCATVLWQLLHCA